MKLLKNLMKPLTGLVILAALVGLVACAVILLPGRRSPSPISR